MLNLACFRIPAFPAWVRRQLDPGADAIAVHDGARIVCRERSLRHDGLCLGESLARARSLFPHATFHEHDSRLDDALWEQTLHLLTDVSPHLVAVAPGIAFLDPYDDGSLQLLAASLRGQVGYAPRRALARLASLSVAPGGVTRVNAREVGAFLGHTPTRHLEDFGVEPEIVERLELFGLRTLGRVVALTRRHLDSQFGPAGRALHVLLHPEGDEPPVPLFQPPPTVTASYAFDEPAIEPGELGPVLAHLISEAVGRLGGNLAGLLTLKVQGGGARGLRLRRRVLKEPTAGTLHLTTIAGLLLDDLLDEREPVETMTLELGGLCRAGAVQGGLFADRPAVFEAVKAIHRRFPGTLVRASLAEVTAPFVDAHTRDEPFPDAPAPRGRRAA